MKRLLVASLIFSSTIASASMLRAGMCLKSPSHPQVVMKIDSVGGVSGLLTTNISGAKPIPYGKAQLEDELKTGVKIEVPCSEFNTSANESKDSAPNQLFGYNLDDSYVDFQKNASKNIKKCRDDNYRKLLGMSNGKYEYSRSQIPVKICELVDKVTITFADVKSDKTFRPMVMLKDLKGQKLLFGVITKKLEEKTKSKLVQISSGMKYYTYQFGEGSVTINYLERNLDNTDLTEVETLEWRRHPTLGTLADQADDRLRALEEKQKLKDSEKNNKEFNL